MSPIATEAPSVIDIVAPFVIAILLLIVGAAAAQLGRQRWVGDLSRFTEEAKASALRQQSVYAPPPELQPDNLGDYADWFADVITSATASIGPVAALLLLQPAGPPSVGTLANVGAAAGTFCLFVWVLAYKDIGGWAAKAKGWFSRVSMIGIAVNVVAAIMAVLLAP